MIFQTRYIKSIVCGALVYLCLCSCVEKKIDFNTEVKPILNKRCISCHGGVKRNANFSLLFRKDALDTVESGKPAIIPFHPEQSEMIRRLSSKDPEVRMPYKEEPLSDEEIRVLTRWIDEGAEWGEHWAYIPPKEMEVPKDVTVEQTGYRIGNEIDYFVLDKLSELKLQPSPIADKETLLRRVHLDITGLPPTVEEAEKFLTDKDPDAYAKVVDRLLASPQFGEKWATWWLDLARYSDTKGYERDVSRTIWRYRDWVIRAFNDDMPFDQFTIEQLAGDLLPDPTDDQLIATGFHRNTMNNDEGGTEDEEFRVAALLDRVSTTWEVWQSTTMGCVQCHTHPYDPFVHEDYYKALAFFNNTRDEDTHGEHPNLRIFEEADKDKLNMIVQWVKQRGDETRAKEVAKFIKTYEPKYHPHDFDRFVNGELIDTKWLGIRNNGMARLKQINLSGKRILIFNYLTDTTGGKVEIHIDSPEGEMIASGILAKAKGGDRKFIELPLKIKEGRHDLYFKFSNEKIKGENPVCNIEWLAFRDILPGKGERGYDNVHNTFYELLSASVENTPIFIENNEEQFRQTFMFERGNWLVKGKPVTPGIPEALNPFTEKYSQDRLGFARWLTSPENPLASRTIVNRIWEQLFGYGLVETMEDFGTQGATPVNQELLDWLSVKMMKEYQWSLRKLIKAIVTSATYRQQSNVTPELYEADPSNRYLARGPRVRLSAEQVRDQALFVTGLLSKKMYGKPVMPYQPEGIWNSVWSGEYWKKSDGEDQYRRSLYTFIKRTSPYPSFIMFDASSREVCLSRRIRTNTPLQALVTMNDSTYLVAATNLATKMKEKSTDINEQIRFGYRTILFKEIPERKLAILARLYNETAGNKKDGAAISKTVNNMENTAVADPAFIVAQALLNLDEVITKE
jgi:hypothetical protein